MWFPRHFVVFYNTKKYSLFHFLLHLSKVSLASLALFALNKPIKHWFLVYNNSHFNNSSTSLQKKQGQSLSEHSKVFLLLLLLYDSFRPKEEIGGKKTSLCCCGCCCCCLQTLTLSPYFPVRAGLYPRFLPGRTYWNFLPGLEENSSPGKNKTKCQRVWGCDGFWTFGKEDEWIKEVGRGGRGEEDGGEKMWTSHFSLFILSSSLLQQWRTDKLRGKEEKNGSSQAPL